MTEFDYGDVILVPFPFTDHSTSMRRPAVVVSSKDYNSRRPDVIIAAVTGQTGSVGGFLELPIEDWEDANLLKPSVLKPVLATVAKTMVLERRGELSTSDREGLSALLQKILG